MLTLETKRYLLVKENLNLSVFFEFDTFEAVVNSVLNKFNIEYVDIEKSMKPNADSIVIKGTASNISKFSKYLFDTQLTNSNSLRKIQVNLDFEHTNKLLGIVLKNHFNINEDVTITGISFENDGVSIVFY